MIAKTAQTKISQNKSKQINFLFSTSAKTYQNISKTIFKEHLNLRHHPFSLLFSKNILARLFYGACQHQKANPKIQKQEFLITYLPYSCQKRF